MLIVRSHASNGRLNPRMIKKMASRFESFRNANATIRHTKLTLTIIPNSIYCILSASVCQPELIDVKLVPEYVLVNSK